MNLNCIGECYRCKKPNARDDNKPCANCVIKRQQYYIACQESIKAQINEYRLKNKEALAASSKIYNLAYDQITIECSICGIIIRQCKTPRHNKSKMHLNHLPKVETLETIENDI